MTLLPRSLVPFIALSGALSLAAFQFWPGSPATTRAGAGSSTGRDSKTTVAATSPAAAAAEQSTAVTYSIDLNSTVTARGQKVLDFRLTGDWLNIKVGPLGREVVVDSRFERPSLTSSTASAADDAKFRAFEIGFRNDHFFSLNSQGVVTQTRLPRTMPSFVQGVVKWVIAAKQFVRTEGADSTWMTEESDATGKYEARYSFETAKSVRKEKLRYLEGASTGSVFPMPANRTEILQSKAIFTLDALGLVTALDVDEDTKVRPEGPLPEMLASTHLRLRLSGVTKLAAMSNEWRSKFAKCEPSKLEDPLPPSAKQADVDQAKIGGRSMSDFLTGLRGNAGSARKDVVERDRLYVGLAALMRQDDIARADAVARVKRGDHDSSLLVDALGSAGSPEAQGSLAELLADTRVDAKNKRGVSIALSLVQSPTKESQAALEALQTDSELGRQASYGLGAFAYQLRQTDPERSLALVNELISRLKASTAPAEIQRYLEALGNAGHPGALPTLDEYLGSADPQIRAGAVRAMRRILGAEVDQRLATVMLRDPVPGVRQAAVEVIDDRPRSEIVVAAVHTCATQEPNVAVRADVVRLLTQWMGSEQQLLAAAQWIAVNDADERIRTTARKALERQQGT